MRPSFKEKIAKFRTYEFCKQCRDPAKKNRRIKRHSYYYPNSHKVVFELLKDKKLKTFDVNALIACYL